MMGVSGTLPNTASGRLIEIDFFRGLVMAMIVVDHISASALSHVTLHAFALCDAAEVFVFLGGFATASAYLAVAARHGDSVARRRFVRRAAQIYRAFLATTTLMLVVSAVLDHYGIDAPNLALDDVSVLLATPLTGLIEVLTFQRQPYLAAVLPMYVLFALAAPVIVPLARAKPWWLAAASVATWLGARWLGAALLDADGYRWSFNPFAWQWVFVLGVLSRCQPLYRRVVAHPRGVLVTVAALVLVAVCAYYKIGSGLPLPEGDLKRNLAWPRVVNFVAIAWLMANLVRYGWIERIARVFRPVVVIGRRGLPCFVAGTVISLTLDSLLHRLPDGTRLFHLGTGLATDAFALGLLMMVAHTDAWFARWRRSLA